MNDVDGLSRDHLASLVQLAAELSSDLSLPSLLNRILGQAARLTESEAGSVFLYDDRRRVLYVAHATGPKAGEVLEKWGARGEGIPIVGSKAGGVFSSGESIVVNDIDHDPEHFKAVDKNTANATRSMICVPLLVAGERIGAVQLINRASGCYEPYDENLLQRFADLSAAAVRNARLVESLAMHMGAISADARSGLDIESIQRLLSAPPVAERATVLFADMRGFTRLGLALGHPELLLARLNVFLTLLADAIGRHSGVVNKFLGDGVLALFRDQAHEARAVACAADIVSSFASLRESWADETNEPLDFLDVGIGIATDSIMIGTVGNEHVREFTAVGRAVGIAAFLVSIARNGRRILCDKLTYRAASQLIADGVGPERIESLKSGPGQGQFYDFYEIRALKSDATTAVASAPAARPLVPASKVAAPSIFVSYSHADTEWLAQLRTHLTPFLRNRRFELWDDTRIASGSTWRREIELALSRACAAVLLVSPTFLSSEFIERHELLPIIDSARQRGLRIYWVPVAASAYDQTEIASFQAVHDPRRPLEQLTPAERNAAWVRICREIGESFGTAAG